MRRDIENVIDGIRTLNPDVAVSQLQVKYPGVDDDGIWYFVLPGVEGNVQVESSSAMCPFIVEHDLMQSTSEAWRTETVNDTIDKILVCLSELGRQDNA